MDDMLESIAKILKKVNNGNYQAPIPGKDVSLEVDDASPEKNEIERLKNLVGDIKKLFDDENDKKTTFLSIANRLGHKFPNLPVLTGSYGSLLMFSDTAIVDENSDECSTEEVFVHSVLFGVYLIVAAGIGVKEYLELKTKSKNAIQVIDDEEILKATIENEKKKGKALIVNAIVRVFILTLFMMEMDTRPISCLDVSTKIIKWVVLVIMVAICIGFSRTKKSNYKREEEQVQSNINEDDDLLAIESNAELLAVESNAELLAIESNTE